MTEPEKQRWQETWQGRTAKLPDGGMARLSVSPDGKVTAHASWPGARTGLSGDCGTAGKAAESHWFAFVKYAARHPKPTGLGKGRPSPSSPRGSRRYRQAGVGYGMPGSTPGY